MNFKPKFQPGRRKLLLASVLAFVLSGCGGSEETKVQQPVATANQAPVAVTPIEVVSREATTNEAQATTESDATLRDYQRVSGISGNLSSIGSDTLAYLMTLWTEGFKRNYPSVNIQVQAAGSSTAPPALTEGTANFGPMSRAMKDKEIEAFESRHGYKPTPILSLIHI